MKKLSCGILVESKYGYLALHPYGRKIESQYSYDIPKGEIQEDEEHLICALRELKEETGIDIEKYLHSEIKDYGILTYNNYKNIHLFHVYLYDINKNFDFKCTSTFESIYSWNLGEIVPEVDDFIWTKDINSYFKNLANMLFKNFYT